MERIYLKSNESKAISSIRVLSTMMIVLCHIFQGLNNELAWWFNIGVQIFLFMSGFLIANSYYKSTWEYLKKRIVRVIVPYWVFLVLVLPLYYLVGIEINIEQILIYLLGIQGFKGATPGLEHLWFISIILVCYIIGLYMNYIRNKVVGWSEIKFWGIVILSWIVIEIVCTPWALGYAPWFATFTTGYFISVRYKFKIPNILMYILVPIVLLTTGIRVFFVYIRPIESTLFKNVFDLVYLPWSKMLLGSLLFLGMYKIFSEIYAQKDSISSIIKFLESIAYEIYLTHQVVILGPLSLLFLTKSLIINIVIILTITIIASIIINKIVNETIRKIEFLRQ